MNLSDNLKKIRKDNNLSQEQLAEKLGVSRQSVSKWESGLAYPEMDKVLQICQLFNLNVDELLNQNIKEVKESKESKANVNKFIDDFLSFITKTIDMFSSMKFKEKIKCLFEQIIVLALLTLIFFILGALGTFLFNGIFSFLPNNLYYSLEGLLGTLYIVFSIVAAIGISLHIFKVRYLDYYIIVKNNVENIDESSLKNMDDEKSDNNENINKKDKIYLEKKQEKIIIRDPKHTQYRFIKGILKCVLFLFKCFISFILVFAAILLVFLVMLLTISFMIFKSGIIFFGSFIIIASAIAIDLIVLYTFYNFILNKKIKTSKVGLTFIISFIFAGIGTGFITIGIKDLNYIDDIESKYYLNDETILPMEDNLLIKNDYYGYDVEYVESDNNDVKIVCRHSKYYMCDVVKYYDNEISVHYYEKTSNFMEHIRVVLDDFNSKKIVDYGKTKIYIYTTKENIDKLKTNLKKYIENEEISRINQYMDRISNLENEKYEQQNKIYDLNQELELKNNTIEELEKIINDYENNKENE